MSVSQWSLTTGRSGSPPPHTEVLGCRLGRGGVPLHLIVEVVSSDGGPGPQAPGPATCSDTKTCFPSWEPIFTHSLCLPSHSQVLHRHPPGYPRQRPGDELCSGGTVSGACAGDAAGSIYPCGHTGVESVHRHHRHHSHTNTESVSSSALIELRGGS